MQNFEYIKKTDKIFFVGIGGISQSALALYLKSLGYEVLGSDKAENEQVRKLKTHGVKVYIGHKKENVIGVNVCVYTSAVNDANPEIAYLKNSGARLIKRSELLAEIVKLFKTSVGVSGTHGKTTTTTMICEILTKSKNRVTGFIGGESLSFGNLLIGSSDTIVFEACEYKKNFLDILPKISVVLNVDNDHADTFIDENDRITTFKKFAENTLCFYNKDDEACKKVAPYSAISFAIKNNAIYNAVNLRKNQTGYSFTVKYYNKSLGRIHLSASGKHNVYNALASFSVAHTLGVCPRQIKSALENYGGVKRRNEYLGKFNGADFYADYAHHPKEISSYLEIYSKKYKDVTVIFQPHTFSRTKALMNDFVKCFNQELSVYIYKTYSARENYDKEGSALKLCENIKKNSCQNAIYLNTDKALKALLNSKAVQGKIVLIIGAGDLYNIVKKFLK